MSNYRARPDRAVRAVLVDLDDTLFDHTRATREALARLVADDLEARTWPFEDVLQRHHQILEALHLEVLSGRRTIDEARVERFRRLLATFGGEPPRARASAWAVTYRAAYEGHWHPVEGAPAFLVAARAAGLRVAVVTNNSRREQELKLSRCGFSPLVDTLVTSEEIGVSKPAAAIFEAALDRLGVTASEAVMLGDGWQTDVAGARAMGIRAVWFNRQGLASPDPAVDEMRSFDPTADALAVVRGQTGVRRGSDRGQTRVRPGSDEGQTGVRPGSDPWG
jgi:putative hydrolase of the HAD superfamily